LLPEAKPVEDCFGGQQGDCEPKKNSSELPRSLLRGSSLTQQI
jgi:hypothetical protein